ncbi:heavy metal-associated domain-containing protein [Mycolicibacterium mucogenicum]|uniref:heavy-metal-associated domain-containing protein n=1 Tax=Mycolicibacterium mucogenicum TaxID=56689 RepID=UPI00226AB4DB|nr:heavy metal-associated domain-containing protein [Mycolicibacterium mucogenicum]MCX8554733.1 heavy metal-associated domain-containing protein [Mycolicibacterium mucogenicum]
MTLTDVTQPRQEAPEVGTSYLDITGMSCVMCARRVQKTLNKIDGVHASVSFATKTATIETARDVGPAELCDAVVAAGYGAVPRAEAPVVDSAARGPLQRFVGGLLGRVSP